MVARAPDIRDLGLIGDQKTVAVLDRSGAVVWYCPRRFDYPSLFAALLDPAKGGVWKLELPDAAAHTRRYVGDSAILETSLTLKGQPFTIKDWMPAGEDLPSGICRTFSEAPDTVTLKFSPAPAYGTESPQFEAVGPGVRVSGEHWLYASHPLAITDGAVALELPKGERGWAALMDSQIQHLNARQLDSWHDATLRYWGEIASRIHYEGPYLRAVADSLRALRLLTYAPNGGVIAAATTSLPEVPGGRRNYDYRYVWLRDTAMIVSAMTRAGSAGVDERRFLDFICSSQQTDPNRPMLPPFMSLDHGSAPDTRALKLAGYRGSNPALVGNTAGQQLQLDGFGNLLLAAKLIYGSCNTRDHWDTVARIADFLVEHWREPDHGIWEEGKKAQYTLGKVVASCGLRYIAEFSRDRFQAERWLATAHEIEDYVAKNCLNAEGAYAAIAGEEAVDVSSVLFPTWGFIAADAPEMEATLRVLDRDCCKSNLYWRHLEAFDSKKEGAFLAGTLWVAQYWVMRNDLDRAKKLLDAALDYSNDLGLFAEEADPDSGKMLGNIPQAFVHAALIGAVIDYKQALEERR